MLFRSAAGFTKETNDCTVRALVNSAGIPYAEAHKLMKKHGRRDRHGATMTSIKNCLMEFNATRVERIGAKWEFEGKGRKVSLKTFCKFFNKGSYYVVLNTHALAVVDGIIHDSFQNLAGRRIDAVWKMR